MDEQKIFSKASNTLISRSQRTLVDEKTKEKLIVEQITKRVYGSKQFWKVYLMDFLTVLGIIDSKQLDVFIYVAQNTDPRNNLFIGTYDKICSEAGVSRPTAAKIFKKLQEHNFIRKVQNGVWYVNPNIIMKGDDHKRQILLSYYENTEPVDSVEYKRSLRPAFEDEDIEEQYLTP